jgi:hypothetical protein
VSNAANWADFGPVLPSGSGTAPVIASESAIPSASRRHPSDEYGTIKGTISELSQSRPDGAFGFGVEAENPIANYKPGTLSVKVTDSRGNSAWGVISAGGWRFPRPKYWWDGARGLVNELNKPRTIERGSE